MNNLPRQILRRILAKYGKDVCSNAKRCAGLLNDLCGSYRREINVLVIAIQERIPLDLLAGASSIPQELLLNRLEKRLEDHTGLTSAAARWAVESWALALGVATDIEIEERERKQSKQPSLNIEKVQPVESEKITTNSDTSKINQENSAQPQKTKTPFPPSKPALPINTQPARMPPSSPPVYAPINKQKTPAQTSAQAPKLQPKNSPVTTKKRFGIFRGCLIVMFLLFVSSVLLLFIVPYAFEAMRETQRERKNEPPRFPIR